MYNVACFTRLTLKTWQLISDFYKFLSLLFYLVLTAFFPFGNQEISVTNITCSSLRPILLRQLTYAQSVRSSSFLNLGREDNLSVIDSLSECENIFINLLHSSIIDIKSIVFQRLLRISRIRRPNWLQSRGGRRLTMRVSEILIGTDTPVTNLILAGVPDASLFITFCINASHQYQPFTNTANNEKFPKEKWYKNNKHQLSFLTLR